MAEKNPAAATSEREISVDLNAADPAKAVTRREKNDIAASVRDAADTDKVVGRTKAEKALFKRMGNLERNLEKQFDQRLAVREAEHQRQIAALQDKLDKVNLDRSSDDKADAAHDAAIAVLKDKLAAAYEKGDSAASAEITLQISKLDAQYWAKKAAAAGVTTRESAGDDKTKTQQVTQQRQQEQPKGPTIAGGRFIRANEEWWDDPEFEVEKVASSTIYLDLVNKEGFDPKDDETYKEVAKRLKAKFPNLPVKAGRKGPEDDEDDEDEAAARGDGTQQQRQRRQAPATRMDDRGDATATNRGNANRRTLTKQEIETMKACRLDPDNDRDVVQFLKEAVSLEAAQA